MLQNKKGDPSLKVNILLFSALVITCPLPGFDIIGDCEPIDCPPFTVVPDKCPCNNDCFKVDNWEDCGELLGLFCTNIYS